MAQDQIAIRITVRVPWWVRPSLWTLARLHDLGLEIDASRAADFVASHIRVEARPA